MGVTRSSSSALSHGQGKMRFPAGALHLKRLTFTAPHPKCCNPGKLGVGALGTVKTQGADQGLPQCPLALGQTLLHPNPHSSSVFGGSGDDGTGALPLNRQYCRET